MKRLNVLLSLTSLDVLLVTIERFSFTTKVVLQPYSFLRLHEVFQMSVIILATVILPFFLLKELSKNFELLQSKKGTILGLIFVIGIYFYSTGNGVHEVASYLFNTFCDTKHFISLQCGSMFFNDYYFGNMVYFIGALLFTIPLILFEQMNPDKTFTKNDYIILFFNSVIYAFAIFAYSAFDLVLVGLLYSIIMTVIILYLLFTSKIKYKYLPYTIYSAVTYTVGTIASLVARFNLLHIHFSLFKHLS